jgi:hypothetical protein
MKPQPKSPLAQLNPPLLNPVPIILPAGKDEQLVQALVELLLNAAGKPNRAATEGEKHEPQADR